MRRNVNRRVITSTDEFLDAGPTGGIRPILVRPGVTLAGLCAVSGVSERRVRSAFYECYQMSPTAYLRVAALNAVRRDLVEGPRLRNAVSHAATAWGFWHLSRFAALRSAKY